MPANRGGGEGDSGTAERHRRQECRPGLPQDGLLRVHLSRFLPETLKEGQDAEWTHGLLQRLGPRKGNTPDHEAGPLMADLLVEDRGVGCSQGIIATKAIPFIPILAGVQANRRRKKVRSACPYHREELFPATRRWRSCPHGL